MDIKTLTRQGHVVYHKLEYSEYLKYSLASSKINEDKKIVGDPEQPIQMPNEVHRPLNRVHIGDCWFRPIYLRVPSFIYVKSVKKSLND